MQYEKIVTGSSEEDIWHKINEDFMADPEMLTYQVLIEQGDKQISLDIDIDPGGGFEGGIETTTFLSKLTKEEDFQFAIHHENFLDEIGKFFGMQDVVTGYGEFDNKVVVKTNDEEKIKAVFENAETRETFQQLYDFTLGITKHKTAENAHQHYLELIIDEGIVDANKLSKIYHAFFNVLILLDGE